MTGTSASEVRDVIGKGAPSRLERGLRYAIPIGLIVLIAVGGLALVKRRGGAKGPAYEMGKAERRDVKVTVTATGTLEAITTVDVGAEVTGRLLQVLVDANDVVKKGQLLAVIDPQQLRAAKAEAAAQVGSALASIRQAQATRVETRLAANRAKEQAKQGLVAPKELEAAVAAAERAEANDANATASAKLSRATLDQAKLKLDKTRILSPIDGLVLSRKVEPGQTVTAGFQTPLLFKLAQDLTQMRLTVDIDEADMGHVREGQEASFSVEAYPDRAFTSRVVSLRNEPKTSQNVVTYQAVLAVDNRERLLRPGMTCTATIVADKRLAVLTVPNAALRFTPATPGGPAGAPKEVGSSKNGLRKQRVWTLLANKPAPLPVQAGASDGTITEILSGDLAEGAAVILYLKEAN